MAMTVPFSSLDELSNRINTVCDDYVKEIKTAHNAFVTAIDDLTKRAEASTDFDQKAGATIVIGRVNRMMVEAAEITNS